MKKSSAVSISFLLDEMVFGAFPGTFNIAI